jgi:putative transposase
VAGPNAGGLADLLNRIVVATAPNQRWVADVTEFTCGDGKLYFAGLRDRSATATGP